MTRRAARCCRAILLATLCTALAAPAVRALDVDTVNGKKTGNRLTFDGKRITIFSDTGNVTLDPSQIKLMTWDDSRATTLERERDTLSAQLEEQKALVKTLRTGIEATSATLAKSQGEAAALNARVKELTLADDPAPALREQIETLNDEIRDLKGKNGILNDQVRRAGRAPATASPTPAPAPFAVTCQPPAPGKAAGLVAVTGTLRNPRTQHYDTIVLDVTAYDSDGKPLAVASTFVSNVDAGAERGFATDLQVADPARVARVAAAVADAD